MTPHMALVSSRGRYLSGPSACGANEKSMNSTWRKFWIGWWLLVVFGIVGLLGAVIFG
jgi:hypothetical protein